MKLAMAILGIFSAITVFGQESLTFTSITVETTNCYSSYNEAILNALPFQIFQARIEKAIDIPACHKASQKYYQTAPNSDSHVNFVVIDIHNNGVQANHISPDGQNCPGDQFIGFFETSCTISVKEDSHKH